MTNLQTRNTQSGKKVLLVDLNNFATFPTLPIGLLVASLRNSGFDAEVISPLALDVPATQREKKENIIDHWKRKLHLSNQPTLLWIRNNARRLRNYWNSRPHPRVIKETSKALDTQPDIILLSAYLQHYQTVAKIGRLAKKRGIPLLLGGPVFNLHNTAQS
jgi:hypothetical protein